MNKPSLESLPFEVDELRQDVKSILKFLADHGNARQSGNQIDKFLTVPEAAEFLSLAPQTIYGLINRKKLACMKREKRVYFSKPDLIAWLEAGHRKTREELASERPILVKRGGSK